MNDLIDNLRRINESDDRYKAKVDVDLHIDGVDIDSVSEVVIEYDLEFEHRSWGVKSVIFTPRSDVDIEIEATIADEEMPITIKVDPKGMKVDWVAGGGFAPQSLYVSATRDGKIKEAELTVGYWTP